MAKRSPSGLAPVQLRAGASPHLPPFSITSCSVSWFDSHRHVVPRPPAPRGDTPGDSPAVAVPPPQPPNTRVQVNLLPLPLHPSVFTLSPFLGGPRCVSLRGRGGSWPPAPAGFVLLHITRATYLGLGGCGLGGGAAGGRGGGGCSCPFLGYTSRCRFVAAQLSVKLGAVRVVVSAMWLPPPCARSWGGVKAWLGSTHPASVWVPRSKPGPKLPAEPGSGWAVREGK